MDRSVSHTSSIDHGCCTIKNFTDVEMVKKVNEDVRPYLETDKRGETSRCTNLVRRSQTVQETWIVDPLVRKLTGYVVDKTTSNFYGKSKHAYMSEAICSIVMTFDVGSSIKVQWLHRDDKNFHVDQEDQTATGYRRRSDTTFEGGAATAVPDSHRWRLGRAPRTSEERVAEMEVTHYCVMLGDLHYAGSANITESEQRILHGFFLTRGFYRGEENIYLANSDEDALSWSPGVQKILFVNFKAPLWHLRDEQLDKVGDFDLLQEAN
ncbi:hypothetical protein BJX63DRAFT_424037 [Aspergillus granulosus]|uniref:Uncharacterized protein n=1 Tax=Aspergillus granulosus TaxID=176169 RepID=A0ABR4H170_9EURO